MAERIQRQPVSEERISYLRGQFNNARAELKRLIIGYDSQIDRLFQALLMGGHVLEDGVPGVAKTLKMKYLAKLLNARFGRITFNVDTGAAELVGYVGKDNVYVPKTLTMGYEMVLADEWKRGRPQAIEAMLECMAERSVTVEDHVTTMPEFFWVVATSNPVDSKNLMEIPHAALDRIAVQLDYKMPRVEALTKILAETALGTDLTNMDRVGDGNLNPADVLDINAYICGNIAVPEALLEFAAKMACSSSPDPEVNPSKKLAEKLRDFIQFGIGPRGAQWLIRLARARAWMDGRAAINGPDLRAVYADVARPRMVLSEDLEPGDFTAEALAQLVFDAVPVMQQHA